MEKVAERKQPHRLQKSDVRNNSLAPRSAIKIVSDHSMKSLDEGLVTARVEFLVGVNVMRYLWTVVGFPPDS